MAVTGGFAAALKITAHDLPPMVALCGFHVHKLNANFPLAAMADDSDHLQFSGGAIVVNAEMNFNFRSHGILDLT